MVNLLAVAARVAAGPRVLQQHGKWLASYDFDASHYLKVDSWRYTWLLCRKSGGRIADLGTYDPASGSLTSSKKESSPLYAGIESVLSELIAR